MEELAISRLCKEFLKNKESIVQGKIHSVFKNVINIEFILHSGEERIITLLTQSSLGLPDSAIITDTCYNNIISIPDYTSIRIIKKNNLIIFGNTGFKIALKQDAGWGEHKDFTVYKPDLNRIRQFISEHRKISSNRKKTVLVSWAVLY